MMPYVMGKGKNIPLPIHLLNDLLVPRWKFLLNEDSILYSLRKLKVAEKYKEILKELYQKTGSGESLTNGQRYRRRHLRITIRSWCFYVKTTCYLSF
jgi:hypothetical protein